jgi:chaperonin GroES
MKFKPLHDKVLVKRVEQETKTSGGILIPDTAKEKPIAGEIIAVGDGVILDNGQKKELVVKTGDKILFGKYSGTEIKLEGVEYIIMKESEILGILN